MAGTFYAVVDADRTGVDYHVGQTSKTMRSKTYMALSISSAIQRLAGIQNSECI